MSYIGTAEYTKKTMLKTDDFFFGRGHWPTYASDNP
jgi:hypothetical protein